MSRLGKQILIATVFILIIAGVVIIVWRMGMPGTTCVDGIQNQGEASVDCGGPCDACKAIPETVSLADVPTIIPTSKPNQIEVVFSVRNPNPQWGVVNLPYEVVVTSEGEQIASRFGSTYILPLSEHVVVEQAIVVSSDSTAPMTAEIILGDAEFVSPPDGVRGVELATLDTIFTRNPNEFNAAEIRGVIRNDSPFSYDAIDIFVVVTDRATGEVVSARRTQMRTLTSAEKREFSIVWREPLSLVGEPSFTVTPLTNLFVDENFLREFGDLERFQLYY